jgi:hypothetical protein
MKEIRWSVIYVWYVYLVPHRKYSLAYRSEAVAVSATRPAIASSTPPDRARYPDSGPSASFGPASG